MIKISYINDVWQSPSSKLLLSFLLFIVNFSGLQAQKDTGIQTFETDNKVIPDISLDAAGEVLAVADGNIVRIFDLESQELLRTLENGHSEKITSITISADNQYLLSADIERQIVLWDFEKGTLLQKLDYHADLIHDIAISPDNRYILSGGMSTRVKLYDLEQEKVVQEIQDHKKGINAVAFSPDTSLMATAGTDKKVRIYALPGFELLSELKGHTNSIRDISFNQESDQLLSTGDDSQVIIWNLKNLQNIRVQRKSRQGSSWIFSVDFYNKDKIKYISGGLDGLARIRTTLSQISWKAGVPIYKILLKPHKNIALEIIVATRGRGVLLVDLTRAETQMK